MALNYISFEWSSVERFRNAVADNLIVCFNSCDDDDICTMTHYVDFDRTVRRHPPVAVLRRRRCVVFSAKLN